MKKHTHDEDGRYYKQDGHKSAVIVLRVTPEEKAAWTAAMDLVRNRRNLSDWLRAAAAHYIPECEAIHQRNEKAARAEMKAFEKKRRGQLRTGGKAVQRFRKAVADAR